MIEEWLGRYGLAIAGAAVAGGLIGLEREYRGHAAGFRTHILVSLSSALLMLAAGRQSEWLGDLPYELLRIDPVRMAHGILTGIGFLCGGVILRQGLSVYGITTAASLWSTSALGVLFGAGLFGLAIGGSVATLLILAALRVGAAWVPQVQHLDVAVRYRRSDGHAEDALDALARTLGLEIGGCSYHLFQDGEVLEVRTVLRGRSPGAARKLADGLARDERVVGFDIDDRND